jgi:hypothetical protein
MESRFLVRLGHFVDISRHCRSALRRTSQHLGSGICARATIGGCRLVLVIRARPGRCSLPIP